jgi:hypothetical protein
MYLCFFCIGAIYYVVVLVIYSYSFIVLAFVKAWILKGVFKASWCSMTVTTVSVFHCNATLSWTHLFIIPPPLLYIYIYIYMYTEWQHNVASHRIFTVSIPVPVCFITCITQGGPVLYL